MLPDEHVLRYNDVWKPRQVACPDGPSIVSVDMVEVVDGGFTLHLADFVDEDHYFIRIMKQNHSFRISHPH